MGSILYYIILYYIILYYIILYYIILYYIILNYIILYYIILYYIILYYIILYYIILYYIILYYIILYYIILYYIIFFAALHLLCCTSYNAIFSGNQARSISQNSTLLAARTRRFLQPELDGSRRTLQVFPFHHYFVRFGASYWTTVQR